jgi:hypothetical protein
MDVKKKPRKIRSEQIVQKNDTPETDVPQIVHLTKFENCVNKDMNKNFETSFCDYSPIIEVPYAYDKEDTFLSIPDNILSVTFDDNTCKNVDASSWPEKTDIYCLWCCHPFDNPPIGLPIKHIKNIFYCTGNFCCFECAASHNYEITDINTNIWERFNLLQLLAKKNNIEWTMKCAKPKSFLKIFGGDLEIDEFRKKSINIIYFENKYPMIPICEQIEELGNTFNTNNKEFFTIKKDKNKQTSIKEFIN